MPARDRLVDADAIRRLRAKDATLFATDPSVVAAVSQRLGWTDLSSTASSVVPLVSALAQEARAEGVTDVVLLGMGGSSLASLVISEFLGEEGVRLHVLDTVSPTTVQRVLDETDPATALYIIASKSGGTIEPNSLYAIFWERAEAALGDKAGSRFIAITDPGTSLVTLAAEARFRETVIAPPEVGGRFSALTVFGLVPAALVGADVAEMLSRAKTAEEACAASSEENPAVELASFIADSRDDGADKLTIVARPGERSFGLWVEQLVAESLGKHGVGVVPVVALADEPMGQGPDCALVVVRMTGDRRLAEWAAGERGRHPVYEIVLDDAYDIAEEFVRWEHAVAMVGCLLGIDPFDQPNVAEAKDATMRVLTGGEMRRPDAVVDDTYLTFAGALPAPEHHEHSLATAIGHVIGALDSGDYLALLAYLPDDEELLSPITTAVPALAAETGLAVCFELGPRYLHSTGQLHKGGPNSGVFILVTTRDTTDVDVPGQPWTLRTLHRAQAQGDLAALSAHDRRVLWIDLPDASPQSVFAFAEGLLDGAGVVHEVLRVGDLVEIGVE